MLDGDLTCARLVERYPELEIVWGAQLGLADEALVRGHLADVLAEITDVRAEIRSRRGWVMDVYALRAGD